MDEVMFVNAQETINEVSPEAYFEVAYREYVKGERSTYPADTFRVGVGIGSVIYVVSKPVKEEIVSRINREERITFCTKCGRPATRGYFIEGAIMKWSSVNLNSHSILLDGRGSGKYYCSDCIEELFENKEEQD